MASQHFFVQGRYLGKRLIPDNWVVPGLEVRRHHSYCLYCLRCGEIWGRLIHDKGIYHQIRCTPCEAHGDGRLSCPPSWTDDPTAFQADWPVEAIRYEFRVTLDRLSKEAEEWQNLQAA
jgi:hypothetical protein